MSAPCRARTSPEKAKDGAPARTTRLPQRYGHVLGRRKETRRPRSFPRPEKAFDPRRKPRGRRGPGPAEIDSASMRASSDPATAGRPGRPWARMIPSALSKTAVSASSRKPAPPAPSSKRRRKASRGRPGRELALRAELQGRRRGADIGLPAVGSPGGHPDAAPGFQSFDGERRARKRDGDPIGPDLAVPLRPAPAPAEDDLGRALEDGGLESALVRGRDERDGR